MSEGRMRTGVIAQKLGMTRIFGEGAAYSGHRAESGRVPGRRPAHAGARRLHRVQTRLRHGQGPRRSKAMRGHLAKAQGRAAAQGGEFRVRRCAGRCRRGDLRPSTSSPVSIVDVSGTTKGKGFAGAMKRHGTSAACAPRTACRFRTAATARPAKPGSGQGLQGQEDGRPYGRRPVTAQNLGSGRDRRGRGLILVKGAVPGPRAATS